MREGYYLFYCAKRTKLYHQHPQHPPLLPVWYRGSVIFLNQGAENTCLERLLWVSFFERQRASGIHNCCAFHADTRRSHSPLVRRQRPPPSRAASYTPLFLFEGANWWYKHAPLLIYILNTSSAALPSTSYPQQTHNSPSAAVAPVLWKVCPTLCLLGHPHGEKNIHQSILSSNIYRNICCVYIQWGNTTGGRNTSAAPSFRILCCLFSSSGSNIIAPTPRHNPGHGQQQISSSSVIYKLYSYSYYTHVYTVGTRCVCGPTCCILDYNQWLLFICYKHSWAKSIACGQPRGAIANRGTVNIKLMIWYMTII